MPNRSSSRKPPNDPVDSAYATMQRIIEQTEADPSSAECLALRERVAVLERLCHEVLQFARVAGLPARVVDALHDASVGASVLGSVLPMTGDDLNAMKGESPAIALGRAGGLKGGKARADALSARRRREIAKRAAAKRWAKKS
jgi:hypothetical protein